MLSRVRRALLFAGWLLALLLPGGALPARAGEPVVRAVLFYSPYCSHCHKVIAEDLPPLLAKYGDRLQIKGIDTNSESGQVLFQSAIQHFNIPVEQQGVPTLIVGDTVLVGSVDIPEKLPQLVETHLSAGGVAWPAIPGLAEALAAQATPAPTGPATATAGPATPEPSATPAPTTGARLPGEPLDGAAAPAGPFAAVRDRLGRDPLGNGLAVAVLLGMLAAVAHTATMVRRSCPVFPAPWRTWAIPALAVVGLGVASYLAYVETAQTRAVCGPVGDCNSVQQSDYARLFGLFPIGVLGGAGYVAILAGWAVGRLPGRPALYSRLALFAMTLFGTLFSIYLTFLEPFVIGATCAWCLTSAVVMTCLLLLAAGPGVHALADLRSRDAAAGSRGRRIQEMGREE